MTSDAVGSERISRIVGYKLIKGFFNTSSPNLPQRIAILAEANHANQSSITADVGVEITSAKQAGDLFGYGSPIHHIMRILRPVSGGLVGGIPTIVYPQAEAGGSAAKVMTITPTGTATANGTHTVVIAGRGGIDGGRYDVNIETGDTATAICDKIEDVINNVLSSPVTASNASPVTEVALTTKWYGLTAQELTVSVETNDYDIGVTYAIAQTQAGSGTPSVATALTNFGNDWVTLVVNGYGLVDATLDELEAFNGIPDPTAPTGRYAGLVMKPFLALSGSVADNPSSVTDSRKLDVTVAVCPAPLSPGFSFEAAANWCALFSRCMQDTPNLDINGKYLPDMPVATSTIAMSDYENRDAYVKKGCSTVDIVAGRYQVQDFVTTYHPDGEVPPQYRYCRNLMLDFNVRYGYYLLELINVLDHTIANDTDTVSATNVIKPKQWKAIVRNYLADLGLRGLIADVPFAQASIVVAISSTNPDRLETFFKYKRTGVARILSTTAEAGFNFGTV